MIDYSKFSQSLKHLEAQHENYINIDVSLPKLTQEAIGESTIQRFEVCYDCMWKVLKRYLAEELGLPNVPNSPKPLFRIAAENQLCVPVKEWLSYANARIDTAYDYSGEKANNALALMANFIKDAKNLHHIMTKVE